MKHQKLKHGNFFYRLFYGYMFQIIKIANNKTFVTENLREIDSFMKYKENNTGFRKYYHLKKNKHSLIIIFLRWIMPHYIWSFINSFYGDLSNLCIPFVLKETISWFKLYLVNDLNPSKIFTL